VNAEKLRYERLYSELERHLKKLKEAFDFIRSFVPLPLSQESVEFLLSRQDGTMALDQIAYRFSKFQDSLGKLLRIYLSLKGENVESLPMLDVVLLLEKFGFDISPEKWFELRSLRNAIAHEYEDDYERIAFLVNKIYGELPYLENLFSRLAL
jgi:hypothetical protein